MAVASTRVIKQIGEYVSKLEIIFAPLFFAIILYLPIYRHHENSIYFCKAQIYGVYFCSFSYFDYDAVLCRGIEYFLCG